MKSWVGAVLLLLAARTLGSPATPASEEEFFIVSSVDPGKSTMVLKRPTEVTLTMQATPKTEYRDEDGKPIRFSNLRAGDTVFISSAPAVSGPPTVNRLRRGPMTVPELHRRYLRF